MSRSGLTVVPLNAAGPVLLLVTDERADAAGLEASLRQEGAPVRVAPRDGGAEVLPAGVDVAIIAMERPDDRYRTAERLRVVSRPVPIVFLTAGAHDPRVEFRGHGLAAVAFVHAPVTAAVLLREARLVLQLDRLRALQADAPRRGEPGAAPGATAAAGTQR